MTKIVAVLNQKGGCGKTTIAVNLAAVLSELDCKAIVVDVDPQMSATKWAKRSNTGPLTDDKFILSRDVHPLEMDNAKKFKSELSELSANAKIVLIDAPPELRETAMVLALISDVVLIPVTPSLLDVWAAQAAVEIATDARALKETDKPRVLLVPSKTQKTLLSQDLGVMLSKLGEPVSTVSITQRVALAECVIAGETIIDYANNSPAHREFQQLARLVTEL